MVVAVVVAFVSAAFFAASSAVQHRVVGDVTGERSGLRLIAQLARERAWWLGLTMSAAAFALHAFALDRGALSLVQPIIVSGLVFAVFIRAALERRLPPRSTVLWCSVTWAGLAAFLVVVHPSPAQTPRQGDAAWCVGVGVLVVIGSVVAAHLVRVDERRGLLFAVASGVLFGLVAGLVKVVLAGLTPRWWLLFTHWSIYALAVVGVGAILLNQRAFQAARLSVTMPVVNICNVFVALAFGFVVFDEKLFASALSVAVEVVGLAAMILGVRQLATRDDGPGTTDDQSEPAAVSQPTPTRS